MSRKIEPKSSVIMTEEEENLRRTDRGKLLFTSYQGRACALFIRNDRLMEASFFPKESSKVGAIYIGKVKKVSKNIDACFVEIAGGETCFLPLKNAAAPYLVNRLFDGRILQGDELLVQVDRDAQKAKRASVTAHISLSNEYFVLATGSTKVGYSLKLSKEKKRLIRAAFIEKAMLDNNCLAQGCDALLSITEAEEMKADELRLEMLQLPPTGLIVRTKAEMLESEEELWKQFYSLSSQFVRLLYIALHRNCFVCLRKADSAWKAVIEQFFSRESHPEEIVTDQKNLYEELIKYNTEGDHRLKIRYYQDNLLSLSKLYSLEKKMENALSSRVWLKSGGFLVIEPTEALTVIDVNSGKYESGRDANETYRKINMEAGEEVARQLRLRNLSGIIIVDFINMQSEQYKKELLHYLRELLSKDTIQTQVIDITPLGLVEITRKKINRPLKEQFLLSAE